MEIERVDEEDFEMVATITRRLWLCRNTVVFGGDLTYSFVPTSKKCTKINEEISKAFTPLE